MTESFGIQFEKDPDNPIIPRQPGTFRSVHVANPDIIRFRDTYWLYFRGQGESGHDQMGGAWIHPEQFDGKTWNVLSHNPILETDPDPKAFDSDHILDPAAIVVDDRVYLYYTAHQKGWKTSGKPSTTALAISDDGKTFTKVQSSPVATGTSPEIVYHDNRYHLFVQRLTPEGFFTIHRCTSKDGLEFPEDEQTVVFEPSYGAEAFDRFSISTVRIWKEDDYFYMTYGGCDRYYDYPVGIGLARSEDLLHWERYPRNPILWRGQPGSWDEGALWFATVLKHEGCYYMWYEGTGTGLGITTPKAREASRKCRQEDYGAYAIHSFSQIGLATFSGNLTRWS